MARIFNFILGNPILVLIILGGLFNAAVRIAQKTSEQRAKREAVNEVSRKNHDALRTGRSRPPTPSPSVSSAQETPGQIRQRRIEALRKERMEQLRALREKRAGVQSSPTISQPPTLSPRATPRPASSFTHPNLPPFLVQTPVQPQAQPRTAAPPRRAPMPQAAMPTRPVRQASQRPARRPQVVATGDSSHHQTPYQQTTKRSSSKSRSRSLNTQFSHTPPPEPAHRPADCARSMLRSRSTLRHALVLAEILDAPIALREHEIASGSIIF